MLSPEPVTTTAAPPASPSGGTRTHLKLVKSGGRGELTALEREFLPPLLEIQETPPSPAQRTLLWTVVALVLALVIWAWFGHVSIVSTAPGKFIPDGRVKQLQPLEASIVKAIHVKEGQHVQQGEVLVELDPTISAAEMRADADKYGFNRLEQARLTAELTHGRAQYAATGQSSARIKLEEQTRRAREQAHAAKLAQVEATLEEKTQALAAAEATLKKYQDTTAIAEERESSAKPLVDTGAISRLDYLQLKQTLAENANDLATQLKTVEQAKAAKVEAERNVDEVKRDRVADIYNDLNQRVASEPALKGDLDKSTELLALKWMRAPVSGVVQKIDATTIGQVVTSAQSLVTIVPDGTPLIVEATVNNQDIGYLKAGQAVEIKVDTFPFQKYGSLRGTLTWVSADAEDKNAASNDLETRSGAHAPEEPQNGANSQNSGYVYKVHVRTEQVQFVVDGSPRPIRAGMTVQADIVTDRRRVIDFFLSPVVKYLDEGLKLR
jgi:hemolysin D